jgi:hypothetical protein
MTWNRLGKLPLQTCFEGRTEADPLQLSVETDSSGLLTTSLTWLAGNKQLVAAPLEVPMMDAISMRQWKDWLDSIMLCNITERKESE